MSPQEQLRSPRELSVDWEQVLQLAAKHRVIPQLHQLLAQNLALPCAESTRATTKQRFKQLTHRALFLTGELLRVVRRLESSGIPCLTFKGPSLARLAYGDLSQRSFDDVDLLVDGKDFLAAQQCFSELGYQSYEGLTLDQQTFQMRSKGEVLYSHPQGGFVDLHTNLSHGTYAYQVTWQDLWNRRQIVDFDGSPAATFGSDDLYLYLAIHGAKHRWQRLNWILDFAQATRCGNYDQAYASAQQIKEHKVLELASLVCCHTFRTAMINQAEPDNRQRRLLAELVKKLENGEVEESRWVALLYLFRARQQPLAALRSTIAEITTPHLPDWNAVRLPRMLWFCYGFIRPVRLLWKYFGL